MVGDDDGPAARFGELCRRCTAQEEKAYALSLGHAEGQTEIVLKTVAEFGSIATMCRRRGFACRFGRLGIGG